MNKRINTCLQQAETTRLTHTHTHTHAHMHTHIHTYINIHVEKSNSGTLHRAVAYNSEETEKTTFILAPV